MHAHLRQLAQAISWVDVGACKAVITRQAVVVQLDLGNGSCCWLIQVGVPAVQRERVADEIHCLCIQTKVSIQRSHAHGVQVQTLMGGGVGLLIILHISVVGTAQTAGAQSVQRMYAYTDVSRGGAPSVQAVTGGPCARFNASAHSVRCSRGGSIAQNPVRSAART